MTLTGMDLVIGPESYWPTTWRLSNDILSRAKISLSAFSSTLAHSWIMVTTIFKRAGNLPSQTRLFSAQIGFQRLLFSDKENLFLDAIMNKSRKVATQHTIGKDVLAGEKVLPDIRSNIRLHRG